MKRPIHGPPTHDASTADAPPLKSIRQCLQNGNSNKELEPKAKCERHAANYSQSNEAKGTQRTKQRNESWSPRAHPTSVRGLETSKHCHANAAWKPFSS